MFRFTIRDVLWLTVVVGFGVGWWVEHHRQAKYFRNELAFQHWYFEQLAEVVKARTDGKATASQDGISVKYPD